MAAGRHLVLIVYDISDARVRARVADALERRMTRVQESVFEGWMTDRQGRALAESAASMIQIDDSLRLYVLPRGGVNRCQAWGFPPAPMADGLLII
jgi:CRISPR-associated endonuclease Cas2